MYPTLIGLTFAAKLIVICLYPCFFNLICCLVETYIHRRYSLHYSPWYLCYFFTTCMYKFCFLPLLPAFASVMTCCVLMNCSPLHNPYCCSLPSSTVCACFICSYVHASTLHPLLAHHHLCYADVYCAFVESTFMFR